jgi:ribose 5-phosphate isomerase A
VAAPTDVGKRAAAHAAAGRVTPGMRLALGTGTTTSLAIEEIARRFPDGGGIVAVASSARSEELARAGGLSVRPPVAGDRYDLMVDGADEVTPELYLTKGGGGALFREKLLARHARELVIAVDSSKLVDRLGQKAAIPIETVPFARPLLLHGFRARGWAATLRTAPDGSGWVTENGNEIIDLRVDPIVDPVGFDRDLRAMEGVVETGIFLDLASRVLVGYPDGYVEERVRSADAPKP